MTTLEERFKKLLMIANIDQSDEDTVLNFIRQELSIVEKALQENEEHRLKLVAEQEKISKQKGYVTDSNRQYIHALDWTHDMLKQTQPLLSSLNLPEGEV